MNILVPVVKRNFLFYFGYFICRLKEFDDVLDHEEINLESLKKLCFHG
jgi:hypothetical protein